MDSAIRRLCASLKIIFFRESSRSFQRRNVGCSVGMRYGRFKHGPGLKEFIRDNPLNNSHTVFSEGDNLPYIDPFVLKGRNRKVYFDVYGCQMNVNDTEIVWSVLQSAGYSKTDNIKDADVILMMTCAIREKAEAKVWNKLTHYRAMKKSRLQYDHKPPLKIGILGCMAERLKQQLVEKDKAIDIVAGPDSYKDLPRLLAITESNETAINVALSLDETYADVVPVRLNQDSVTAYVSIMRGCDNMCTYCIVPFTRGRERSRPAESILREVQELSSQGVKEITLLGQNVNSYRDISKCESKETKTVLAKGFRTVYKPKKGGMRFAELLDQVSQIDPELRIRFTSPHPKDFPDEVLEVIRDRKNVCCNLHLPAQSGNNAVLERMRRGYTRESYLELVDHIRDTLPEVTLSSDFICGFCGETDKEFEDTLSLMRDVKYHVAYLFAYSMREKTTAYRRFVDDVPASIKQERLLAMVSTFREEAESLNKKCIGQIQIVLIEGESKRSNEFLAGRNDGNIKVIVPSVPVPAFDGAPYPLPLKKGNYVCVEIEEANSQVLKGRPLFHTTLNDFNHNKIYQSASNNV